MDAGTLKLVVAALFTIGGLCVVGISITLAMGHDASNLTNIASTVVGALVGLLVPVHQQRGNP